MHLRAGTATDVGRVRVLNEDASAARPEQGLFVVCDGMGGEAAGEVASALAVATIVERAADAGDLAASPGSAAYLPRTMRLADAVRLANRRIFEQAEQHPDQTGMGTTIIAAWIYRDVASLAHVGDSRAYLWRDGRLEALTRDHSLVEAQVKAGMLNREESLKSEHQNILLRALGREPEVEVELAEVPLRAGDYVLLCSDGLTRMVPEREMAETLSAHSEPQSMAEALVEAANRNGGADNVTAVVVEVRGTWWQRLRS